MNYCDFVSLEVVSVYCRGESYHVWSTELSVLKKEH